MTRLFAFKLVDEALFEQLKTAMISNVPEACGMKALSYYHSNDSQRHLAGELLARFALETITGSRPTEPFITGDKGKPHPDGYLGTHFNVSHSGCWVVVATSPSEVGVDVERMRKVPEGVAYRFFSEPEKQMLDNAHDESEKAEVFFTLWTLKESFLKAIGRGLTKSLSTFTVLKQDGGDYLLSPDAETSGYYLKSYRFEQGYKLAACSAHHDFDHQVTIVSVEELV